MPEDYKVQAGDCISSIAFDHGFFWETLWNHSKNANLKSERRDPNILKEGDVVHIPDLSLREESRATEKRHRFKLKGAPAKLRLRIMEEPRLPPPPAGTSMVAAPQNSGSTPLDNASAAVKEPLSIPGHNPRESITEDQETETFQQPDEPRANVPYLIEIDGTTFTGRTDSDGRIEHHIPPNARQGRLILEPGSLNEVELPLNLGHLNPLMDASGTTDVSGVKHRLANLGFDCGDRSDETTPELEAALRAFQQRDGLQVTGEVDQPTRDRILQLHGS